MILMKRTDKRDPYPPPPTLEELRWHAEGHAGIGPSNEDFVIDYLGAPQGLWNLAATAVFLGDFKANNHLGNAAEELITAGFRSHLASLRKIYKNSLRYQQDMLAKADDNSKAARSRRRLTVRSILI